LRIYTILSTKAWVYVVFSEKSEPQGLYLPNESIFKIDISKIDLSKTIAKEKGTPIPIYSNKAKNIEAFHQYDNALYIYDWKDKLNTTFIDIGSK